MGKEVLSSVWLVPTEKDVERFKPVIDDLSKRHGVTPFLPHITIWGAVTAPQETQLKVSILFVLK